MSTIKWIHKSLFWFIRYFRSLKGVFCAPFFMRCKEHKIRAYAIITNETNNREREKTDDRSGLILIFIYGLSAQMFDGKRCTPTRNSILCTFAINWLLKSWPICSVRRTLIGSQPKLPFHTARIECFSCGRNCYYDNFSFHPIWSYVCLSPLCSFTWEQI